MAGLIDEPGVLYLLSVLAGWFYGLLSSAVMADSFSRKWYQDLKRPPIHWLVFSIAWTIWYTLLGVIHARVYEQSGGYEHETAWFILWHVQLIFTVLYSLLIRFALFRFATLSIVINIGLTAFLAARAFHKDYLFAAIALCVYGAWLIFALCLGLWVWYKNSKAFPVTDRKTRGTSKSRDLLRSKDHMEARASDDERELDKAPLLETGSRAVSPSTGALSKRYPEVAK